MSPIDFIGTIVLIAVLIVNVSAVIAAMQVSQRQRLALGATVGLWAGLQIALANAGAYHSPIPYIGVSVMLPLLAAAVALRVSPSLRSALTGVPTSLLVGLNISRVLGVFFLLLAADGRLGGPFPHSAGWGDIVTGAIALPLALALVRGVASRGFTGGWNAFGLIDLVTAVGLGVVSGPGSPVQLIAGGVGPTAIADFPWTLIPTVLVPFYLIVHAIVFMQLRQADTLPNAVTRPA